jgi:hypothetical protein
VLIAAAADHKSMTLIVLLFIVVVGPLALLYGADSRIDDHRR